MSNLIIRTVAVFVFAVSSFSVHATNGYFSHGYGSKNKGLAGAGVALANDAMIGATNPAGMVKIGERMDIGLALFSPTPRSYSATADAAGVPDAIFCGANCPFTFGGNGNSQSIESENDYFLIPHFAYNWMLNDNSSFGLNVYGNGGMNTEYKGGVAQHNDGSGTSVTTAGTFGAGTSGVNLEQLFISSSYSQIINQDSTWGASLILAFQRFEAKGLANFGGFSTSPGNLSNNGTDTSNGYGIKLGYQSTITDNISVGVSYQSEMDMSEFDEYSGLFADNGDFDIPATWTLGLVWTLANKSLVVFDIQKIMYGDIPPIANPISNLVNSTDSCATGNVERCLGGGDGAGFGWDDMTIYKLGYEFSADPDWVWRVGYSHGKQPISSSEVVFNILAPAIIEDHLTFGFTHHTSTTSEINFQFMHALNNTITGTNPLNPTQEISLEMEQYELELSWGWRF